MNVDELIEQCYIMAHVGHETEASRGMCDTLEQAAIALTSFQRATRSLGFVFCRGESVHKSTGDYIFSGKIVQPYFKLDNRTIRYIVEDTRGLNLIVNEKQLQRGLT
jgi:hypothetical protein